MYLDQLSTQIREIAAETDAGYTGAGSETLYRFYAVLALAKGEATTAEDVHNAWSVWAMEHRPQSRCIVPFAELPPNIQAMDEPWAGAIRAAARRQHAP